MPQGKVSAWAVAGALVLACDGEPPDEITCDKTEQTIYDPFAHAVCADSCVDALDCPRGTLCAKTDEGGRGRCEVPTDALQTSRGALLAGFGVAEMSAALRTEDALELAWTRPEGARVVNCVLLACPPAFRIAGDDGWLVADDPSRAEIANYDRCALATELSTEPEGSFSLREKDNQHEPGAGFDDTTSSVDTKTCSGWGCEPITELLAGCWAYDDTRIVAATRLFRVDTSEGIYNYHGAFASAPCDCAPDGDRHVDDYRACLLAGGGEPRYGVCVCSTASGDWCRQPCRRDLDCEPTGSPDDASGEALLVGYCDDEQPKKCRAVPGR